MPTCCKRSSILMNSSFCFSTGKPFLDGQSILLTVAIHAARNSYLGLRLEIEGSILKAGSLKFATGGLIPDALSPFVASNSLPITGCANTLNRKKYKNIIAINIRNANLRFDDMGTKCIMPRGRVE